MTGFVLDWLTATSARSSSASVPLGRPDNWRAVWASSPPTPSTWARQSEARLTLFLTWDGHVLAKTGGELDGMPVVEPYIVEPPQRELDLGTT